ncbi:imidazole glycerol phosphate synthase subunit HisH [Brevundimonas fluminis]|uniref:imidazole glycerol phosphate synthase subunit HisH n=1 Tax=Brevundimonas fluminis TaxID=2487274 RepID=UPI000F658B64|nr:imidazole glycerol phosphate synthase subunit HisH [Brevundimonas fluminis]
MNVHIVDYGVGNLHSMVRAVEASGGSPVLVTDADAVLQAEKLILPGVGAFEPCARQLRASGMWDAVKAYAQTGRPFVGVCVGMQLLFDESLEFGRHEGLGLIGGQVAQIPSEDAAGARKVPHIGWRPLARAAQVKDWSGTLLEGLTPDRSSAYFVHSYSCVAADDADRLCDVDYLGFRVSAAVRRGNVSGFQFHPEKSGPVGLTIMRNLVRA